MDIKFADSFFKSLKRMQWQNTIIYKTYSLFRYKIPWFIKNIIHFSKELYNFRPWSWEYNLDIFKRSIELTCNNIEKYGIESDEGRLPKIANMRKVILSLDKNSKDDFYPEAEKKLGLKYVGGNLVEEIDENGNKYIVWRGISEEQENIDFKISKCAREIEEECWKNIWVIISDDMKGWWD